jgi:hypothetical protein
MAVFGGFTPWPLRFGGGEGNSSAPLLQRVFESIAAQRGDAYDQTVNSTVGVENMAFARAITFDGWLRNQKLANEFQPTKCTAAGLLPRWERIFATPPNPTDTEPVRRARVSAAWLRLISSAAVQSVTDALSAALGPLFVGLVFQTPATAVAYWPGGTQLPGFPWFSTIALINVQLTIPSGYANADGSPNAQWWAATGAVFQILDPMLPAYDDFQWYVNNPQNPSETGWILDTNELDLEAFDS